MTTGTCCCRRHTKDMDAQGVFYEGRQLGFFAGESAGPFGPALQSVLRQGSFRKYGTDINGRIGALNFVYSGAVFGAHFDQIQDYTQLRGGTYADYYQCLSPAETGKQVSAIRRAPPGMITSGTCIKAMNASSTPMLASASIGGSSGKTRNHEQTDWLYKTAPGFTDIVAAGSEREQSKYRNDNDAFFDDSPRLQSSGRHSHRWILTSCRSTDVYGRTRYYRFDNIEIGSAVSSLVLWGRTAAMSGDATIWMPSTSRRPIRVKSRAQSHLEDHARIWSITLGRKAFAPAASIAARITARC